MNLFPRIRHIHFVGIGGIGMSGIAEVLINLGYRVTGSDLAEGQTCRRLADLGAGIAIGHRSENVGDAHVVVVSSAVKPTNPEVQEALSRGIPVIPRAEMLAELMRMKHGLAVAGAHGKTTTTSMLATCLAAAGLDPTVVIGGKLNSLGSNAKLGQGPYLVAEADESDGSFLKLSPTLAVVTNIDPEHLDFYEDLEAIKRAFARFVDKVPFYGAAVLCLDDPNVRRIIPELRRHIVTYGLSPQADLRAEDLHFEGASSRFTVWRGETKLGELRLGMPGRHNVLNALAATAASLELEIPFERIAAALEGFTGVHRRFQRKGEVNGVLVVDDYGHHPSEIRATLAAARGGFHDRRVVVAFQPHRYTRTRDLFEEFVDAFQDAHELILTDIYAAGEEPITGISSERLYHQIKERGHRRVSYVADRARLLEAIEVRLRPGDLLLTLGAGDIWKVGEAYLKAHGATVEGTQA
jgi:UDP-N-acetylmuramate--alanine ligase